MLHLFTAEDYYAGKHPIYRNGEKVFSLSYLKGSVYPFRSCCILGHAHTNYKDGNYHASFIPNPYNLMIDKPDIPIAYKLIKNYPGYKLEDGDQIWKFVNASEYDSPAIDVFSRGEYINKNGGHVRSGSITKVRMYFQEPEFWEPIYPTIQELKKEELREAFLAGTKAGQMHNFENWYKQKCL